MRKMWKTALAITLVLGLWGAAVEAQPLITGNTAAFGNGPINTWDFTLVPGFNLVHSFVPQSAVPGGTNNPNGRGLAIGGDVVYYTELSGADGFGPTAFITRAPYGGGVGGLDILPALANPRPGFGIQDLTIFNSKLYSLTGYPDMPPVVFVQNLSGGTVGGPFNIPFPAGTDSDGFAVLPNGNFLINRGDTSCIYDEYDKTDGHFIGNTINVPGNVSTCTGVDTDGTSLYFLTDFDSITKTDFTGNITDFRILEGTFDTEDISLVHPVTSITGTGDGHFFFTLRNTDDIVSKHDFLAELLKNGAVVATGLTRCYSISARNIPGHNALVPISLPSDVALVSGDVLSLRLSTRMGTNPDDTQCPGGHFSNNGGLRFFYDSPGDPSQFKMTIAPAPEATFYLHSDGTTCTNALGESQPTATLNRFLSDNPPTVVAPKCKEVPNITFAGGNPWRLFSTWSLAPLP